MSNITLKFKDNLKKNLFKMYLKGKVDKQFENGWSIYYSF